jgi:hypothetical protein
MYARKGSLQERSDGTYAGEIDTLNQGAAIDKHFAAPFVELFEDSQTILKSGLARHTCSRYTSIVKLALKGIDGSDALAKDQCGPTALLCAHQCEVPEVAQEEERNQY